MDPSGRSFLINFLTGGATPTTQIYVNLALNLITILTSFLLIGFLNGYYDALEAKTGEGAPNVIYLVYAFLTAISLWQFFGIVVGIRLKTKLGRKKIVPLPDVSDITPENLPNRETRTISSQRHPEKTLSVSATEEPTRILENPRHAGDRSFDRS